MSITFKKATVSKEGDPIISAQHNALAQAFDDRIPNSDGGKNLREWLQERLRQPAEIVPVAGSTSISNVACIHSVVARTRRLELTPGKN
jgi:hypothetical protein